MAHQSTERNDHLSTVSTRHVDACVFIDEFRDVARRRMPEDCPDAGSIGFSTSRIALTMTNARLRLSVAPIESECPDTGRYWMQQAEHDGSRTRDVSIVSIVSTVARWPEQFEEDTGRGCDGATPPPFFHINSTYKLTITYLITRSVPITIDLYVGCRLCAEVRDCSGNLSFTPCTRKSGV